MKAKDFILLTLDDEISKMRLEIRAIKKDQRIVEDMKKVMRNKTEKEIMETILNDEALKKNYENMSKKIENMEREAVQKMVREGKLKEVQLDGKGKIISEASSTDSGQSEQSVNGDEL